MTHTKKVEKDFLEKISMHVTNMEWAAKRCRHLADELTNMARYHTKLAVELRSLKQAKKPLSGASKTGARGPGDRQVLQVSCCMHQVKAR